SVPVRVLVVEPRLRGLPAVADPQDRLARREADAERDPPRRPVPVEEEPDEPVAEVGLVEAALLDEALDGAEGHAPVGRERARRDEVRAAAAHARHGLELVAA